MRVPLIWVGPAAETNFRRGRAGWRVDRMLHHWTVASAESAIATFKRPGTYVSAHLVVDRDGIAYQVVDFADESYNGEGTGPNDPPRDPNMNERCISVEAVSWPGLDPAFTEEQYATLAALDREIGAAYDFPLIAGSTVVLDDSATVYPHKGNTRTACPDGLDIDRIVREANMATGPQLIEKRWTKDPAGQTGWQPGDPCNADAIHLGEVVWLQAAWQYPNATIYWSPPAKLVGSKLERQPIPFWPVVDPATDPTIDLGATEALFVVDVLPSA